MNILVPLAGRDESFIETFNDLKPFIDIHGTTLIEFTLGCLPFDIDKLIFVCLKEHDTKFKIGSRLKKIFGRDTKIILSETVTEGSACSALLVKDIINIKEDLLIDLSDIYFDPESLKQDVEAREESVKGIVPISRDTVMDKPWGYIYTDESGYVKELREKEITPESSNATLGLYYFTHGSDFVKYAEYMVKNNLRVQHNNLFHIGPVYNIFIKNNAKIATSDVKIISSLGSPAEILNFINSYRGYTGHKL